MNYARMANKKLYRLIQLRVPWMSIEVVDETNRETVIGFLKFLDGGATQLKKLRRTKTAA